MLNEVDIVPVAAHAVVSEQLVLPQAVVVDDPKSVNSHTTSQIEAVMLVSQLVGSSGFGSPAGPIGGPPGIPVAYGTSGPPPAPHPPPHPFRKQPPPAAPQIPDPPSQPKGPQSQPQPNNEEHPLEEGWVPSSVGFGPLLQVMGLKVGGGIGTE